MEREKASGRSKEEKNIYAGGVRLDKETHEKLKILAFIQDTSVSSIIRSAVTSYVESQFSTQRAKQKIRREFDRKIDKLEK